MATLETTQGPTSGRCGNIEFLSISWQLSMAGVCHIMKNLSEQITVIALVAIWGGLVGYLARGN